MLLHDYIRQKYNLDKGPFRQALEAIDRYRLKGGKNYPEMIRELCQGQAKESWDIM